MDSARLVANLLRGYSTITIGSSSGHKTDHGKDSNRRWPDQIPQFKYPSYHVPEAPCNCKFTTVLGPRMPSYLAIACSKLLKPAESKVLSMVPPLILDHISTFFCISTVLFSEGGE